MLEVQRLGYRYPKGASPALYDMNLVIEPGMFLAVVGPSGSGKSTLLRSLNGLVPHFHGGSFGGRVLIDGSDTREGTTADLSRTIGFVSQEPEGQTVFDTVVDEIAFGPENLGMQHSELVARVEAALETLGIRHLRNRDVANLSGGERQRVVIAATLAMGSRVLVMDEPLSQLDPWAAQELLCVLRELNREHGITVVIAEHRIDHLLPNCTHVLELAATGRAGAIMPVTCAVDMLVHQPSLVRIAEKLDWPEVPWSIAEAQSMHARYGPALSFPEPEECGQYPVLMTIRDASVVRGRATLLEQISLDIASGTVTALMGRNGSGKTTLLRAMAGLQSLSEGEIGIGSTLVHELPTTERASLIGFVPQQPSVLFLGQTVREEIEIALEDDGSLEDPLEILARFGLEHLRGHYSYDISGGERQRLALAIVIARRPDVLLLDEPTRGMDLKARKHLESLLRELTGSGCAVVLATHDSELCAQSADRVVRLEAGRPLIIGNPAEVLASDPALTTDIGRIFGSKFTRIEDIAQFDDRERNSPESQHLLPGQEMPVRHVD